VACAVICHLKIQILTEMPMRDVTLSYEISLFEQIKNQPPNPSHHQLAEITGLLKVTIACILQQQHKLRDEWTLCHRQQVTSQKWKREGKDPDAEEGLYCNWNKCMCQWSNVEKQVRVS
jgi:hypothetical protein